MLARVPMPPVKSWIFFFKFQDLESPGKSLWSWKLRLKVLESPGKISLKMHIFLLVAIYTLCVDSYYFK